MIQIQRINSPFLRRLSAAVRGVKHTAIIAHVAGIFLCGDISSVRSMSRLGTHQAK